MSTKWTHAIALGTWHPALAAGNWLLVLFAGSYFSSSLSRLISMMVTVVVRLRLGDLFSGQLGCVAEVQNIVFN